MQFPEGGWGVNKNEKRAYVSMRKFQGSIKIKSGNSRGVQGKLCGISMGPGFWPWNFQGRDATQFWRNSMECLANKGNITNSQEFFQKSISSNPPLCIFAELHSILSVQACIFQIVKIWMLTFLLSFSIPGGKVSKSDKNTKISKCCNERSAFKLNEKSWLISYYLSVRSD